MKSPIIDSLLDYTNEQSQALIIKANFGQATRKHTTIATGVKFKSALNDLTINPVAKDNKTCGFGGDSTATLSQRILSVGNFKYEFDFCVKALLSKWAGYAVKANGQDSLPFAEYFVNGIANDVATDVDRQVWVGDTSKGDLVQGIINIAAADAATVKVAIPAATTAYAAVKQMVSALPAAVAKKNAVIFCSPEFLTKYNLELVDLNLYHFVPAEEISEIKIPGTNIILAATDGLNGKGYLFAGSENGIVYGMDGENDLEEFQAWYSQDADSVRFRIALNAGMQYAFSDQVVLGTIGNAENAQIKE